ncbi:hypothetical protein H7I01_06715 [Mycobacterium palustre]|nr:hypothetical protein [Mycobacterium palustre]
MAAVLAWRQHPTEIECDLADRGHDIFDWHAGRMSSRRLLVLLKEAPERGPYKTALRGGRWPELETMIAELHKEFAAFRASHYVGTEHEYTPKMFVDPSERAQILRDEAEAEAFIEEAQEDMFDQLGWS